MYDIQQIGFLTEWQLYAQKVEGDAWKGEKIEEGKLQKLSGTISPLNMVFFPEYTAGVSFLLYIT